MQYKLMVVDGNSLMFRAFYALPPLTNSRGEYTNGVHGFLSMFLKAYAEYKPEYICVAFDRKAPTFRHKEYSEYKAGRKATPPELFPQFDILKDVLKTMGVCVLEIDGYEADDILGTLSIENLNTLIVTGDKDALQLVSENTAVLLNKKGITDTELYNLEYFREKYGIEPTNFVDVKALMGDKSDNIPGVPGIGEKTALTLISKYKTIENLYDNIEELPPKKTKTLLEENIQSAMMSKRLAKIDCCVPVDYTLKDLEYNPPKKDDISEVFERYGLKTIFARITGEELKKEDNKTQKAINIKTVEITDIDTLKKQIYEFKSKHIAVLFEKNYISLAVNKNEQLNIFIKENMLDDGIDYYELLSELKSIFEDQNIEKVLHDIKNTMHMLNNEGIYIKNCAFDLHLAAYLLLPQSNSYPLDKISAQYLESMPINGAAVLLHMEDALKADLKVNGMLELYEKLEHPLINVLYDMEVKGFMLDKDILKELDEQFTKEINSLQNKIIECAGEQFNVNSPKQLEVILFEKLKLPAAKKTKSGYSTDVEVLEKLFDKHPIIPYILDYRKLAKLKSTYIVGLYDYATKGDFRVHSTFHQTVTATGRLSSSDPNLQNIPIRTEIGREVRKAFIAGEGCTLIGADYSQIELRVLAHIAGDENMTKAFISGADIHTITASEVFGVPIAEVTSTLRSAAKAVNFGIVYGISDYGLARNINITRSQAKQYIEKYFERYPAIKSFMDDIVKKCKQDGYVTTLMGRKRFVPEIDSHNYNVRSFGERIAMNTPIQGSAADIIKKAMLDITDEIKARNLKSRLLLQIHDELIFEAPFDEEELMLKLVKEKMENVFELDVPLIADAKSGRSWFDTK